MCCRRTIPKIRYHWETYLQRQEKCRKNRLLYYHLPYRFDRYWRYFDRLSLRWNRISVLYLYYVDSLLQQQLRKIPLLRTQYFSMTSYRYSFYWISKWMCNDPIRLRRSHIVGHATLEPATCQLVWQQSEKIQLYFRYS